MHLMKKKKLKAKKIVNIKKNNAMAEDFNISGNLSDEEKYKQLIDYSGELIRADEPKITSLANICALLKYTFDKISWVGFYFALDDGLYLGPYQGKIACNFIATGKGVCGTAAQKRETIIVDDVDKFPGHIACDGMSKSEIVVPVIVRKELFAVLDLDSHEYSAFDETDKKYLELLIETINHKIDLNLFILS